jgi:hypothetical protein
MGLQRVTGYGDSGDDSIGVLFAAIHHLKIPALEKILLFSLAVEYSRLPGI